MGDRLVAGPVGARLVYRWLRRNRLRSHEGALYLSLVWPRAYGEPWDWPSAFPATSEAMVAFDGRCKTLESEAGLLEVRTRSWGGRSFRPWERQWHPPRSGYLPRGDWRLYYKVRGDRHAGLWYARKLAAVLRAAWREGVDLVVEVFRA